jgi:LMBR1 domain-containing protein 1
VSESGHCTHHTSSLALPVLVSLPHPEDLELSLRRNQENIQYLQSQYDLSGRPWSREDKKQLDDLKREGRRLQSLRQSRLRTGGSGGRRTGGEDPDELSCWDKCWNILVPVRLAIAIPLLLLSLLIIVSLSITVIDKFVHSACGPSCGYTLAKTRILNPIDEAFKGLSKAFPLDCIFFAGLVLFIFLACVSGIVGLGVRFFMFKLYSIQKGRTLPNAFLMAAWMLQLMTLTLNLEILTIAPTYASFGNQFYFNETSQMRQECDTDLIGVVENTCVQTQIGRFITTMSVETPFFSVILFYGNLAFIAFYLLFLGHGVFCADNSKKEEVDAFRKLDDLSD